MNRLELACVCGRAVPEDDQIALCGRRPCPECGSRARRWQRSWPSFFRRLLRPRRWPAFLPGRGPRHFAPDWGFDLRSLTRFTAGAVDALGLKKRKNRWRFREL